ncbi:hypothetical protein KC887_07675 [Candidatus Kaiserbacteria bacterium]|nr:hypothetical protein [Candidatus Kaiserbacteria bacterium]
MAWYDLLGGLIKPVTDLVDDLHTSEEEKLTIKQKLYESQAQFASVMLRYESELIKNKADIIRAEAQGQSWLQRSWRPITMLTFLALVVCDSFGLLAFRLADQAWTLLQIGLGGYVVGRSAEKIAPKIAESLTR